MDRADFTVSLTKNPVSAGRCWNMDSQLPRPLRKRSIRSAIGTSRLASPAPAPTAMDCRCLEGWFFVARTEGAGGEHDAGGLDSVGTVQIVVCDVETAARVKGALAAA